MDEAGVYEAYMKKNKINCRFIYDIEELDFDKDKSIAVFRIVQEALTNIIKYAQASGVVIEIKNTPGNVTISVADNGNGFSIKEIENKKTMGIMGMKERAEIFGGKLDIESSPGNGTKIILSLPKVWL